MTQNQALWSPSSLCGPSGVRGTTRPLNPAPNNRADCSSSGLLLIPRIPAIFHLHHNDDLPFEGLVTLYRSKCVMVIPAYSTYIYVPLLLVHGRMVYSCRICTIYNSIALIMTRSAWLIPLMWPVNKRCLDVCQGESMRCLGQCHLTEIWRRKFISGKSGRRDTLLEDIGQVYA